jgi:hypothetical protein
MARSAVFIFTETLHVLANDIQHFIHTLIPAKLLPISRMNNPHAAMTKST